jgi:3-hydroxyisobutyrate dehydrogenase-like beta-hydroxyacid dehydrogenase
MRSNPATHNAKEAVMKIGFIGLGMMGAGMASNLLKAGNELMVHDLTRQAASNHLNAGATWAESPRALAEACDLVFTSLPTPADVRNVGTGKDGLIEGFRKGAAWFDLSTNAVDVVRDLHATFAEKGISFLDAPVSGGPKGANSGRLAIWVGGDKAVFDKYHAALTAMGDQAAYIGPIGAGSIAKLVHNATSAAVNVVLAEVFTMGIKAGVEPLSLFEAVRQGASGRSRMFDRLSDHFLTGSYDPADFALRLLHKDVSLACQLARDVQVPMRLTNMALMELTEALNRGWDKRDSRVAALLQQERAGIPPIQIAPDKIKAVLESDAKSLSTR